MLTQAFIQVRDLAHQAQVLRRGCQGRFNLGGLRASQLAVHERVELGLTEALPTGHLTLRIVA